MTRSERNARPDTTTGKRKPRILVAGEFSAGKTQLINGLLGHTVLPSNVTATALPPIWLVGGHDALAAVDLEGETRPLDTLDGVNVEDTHFCIRSCPAPFLEEFDIIDTPGNSDPNIPSECWERMLDFADMVVWCTNATQAWRQSEKSVWDEMPEHLLGTATLLVTHADRITDARSSERVLRRVRREAGKYFSSFLMGSLLKQDDLDTIAAHLRTSAGDLDPLHGLANKLVREFPGPEMKPRVAAAEGPKVQPRRVKSQAAAAQTETPAVSTTDEPMATVHEFTPVAIEEKAAPGSARAIWQDLVRDVDQTDAAALRACVDRLIEKLDQTEDEVSSVASVVSDPEESADAVQAQVQHIMSRRTS